MPSANCWGGQTGHKSNSTGAVEVFCTSFWLARVRAKQSAMPSVNFGFHQECDLFKTDFGCQSA
eukprot:4105240-Amphidinium_carterae.1